MAVAEEPPGEAETDGGIVKTWKPWTTTGRASEDRRVGNTRIDLFGVPQREIVVVQSCVEIESGMQVYQIFQTQWSCNLPSHFVKSILSNVT